MARTTEKGVSLRPKDQEKGTGGLWPQTPSPATILSAGFALANFTKKDGTVVAKNVPCLEVEYQAADGEKYVEQYSCGNGWKVTPERLIPQNGQTGLNDGCNAALFFNSLEEAKYDMSSLDDDVSVLEGLEVIVHRRPQPKREGGRMPENPNAAPKTIVLIAELADAKPAKGKKKAAEEEDEDERPAKKGKPASKGKGADEITETAKEALIEAVTEEGGKVRRTEIADLVKATVKGHPKAAAIVSLFDDDELLETEDGWTFSGKYVEVGK